MLKINKMNIDDREKNNLYDRAQIKIKEIITRNLQKFIKHLKDGNYKEGKNFLINYFSQIYINPKPLLGHLLIFIEIYKLISDIKKSIK